MQTSSNMASTNIAKTYFQTNLRRSTMINIPVLLFIKDKLHRVNINRQNKQEAYLFNCTNGYNLDCTKCQ